MKQTISNGGHQTDDTQVVRAAMNLGQKKGVPHVDNAQPIPGQRRDVTQATGARQTKDGQERSDTQHTDAVLSELREVHKLREDFHREEKSLTLRIKAIDRRLDQARDHVNTSASLPDDIDDGARSSPLPTNAVPQTNGEDRALSTLPTISTVPDENGGQGRSDTHKNIAPAALFVAPELFEARQIIHLARLKYERRMKKLAKGLPVYDWMKSINGFGELGLAQIIAETGDLSNYANPSKVWKRMGLAVFGGKAQRKVRGEEGILQGYSPRRRAIMYCIGDSLIKKQNEYREIYLDRKVYECAKLPDAAKIHTHRRAQRYMEKRLLKNLWQEWQRVA